MKSNKWLASLLFITAIFSFICADLSAQPYTRKDYVIPDIPGYITLKCDFHTHTMFSDGAVWPTVRVEEAWMEGLDAIATSDHIENHPNKKGVSLPDRNLVHEIAREKGEELNVICINGAEITRDMPPGHLNAIFLKDVNPLDTPKWRDAIKSAIDQEAFVFWNHPGWRQPNNIPIWYDEHTEIFENGWMHGMEVVNGYDYYPLAHQWCLDKKITMLANSDVHAPISFNVDFEKGQHRPMTLVFAKERTAEGIKEALINRRTAVHHGSLLIGEEQYVRPIYEACVTFENTVFTIKGRDRGRIRVKNTSDIPFELVTSEEFEELTIPKSITLHGQRTVIFTIRGTNKKATGLKEYNLKYTAKNVRLTPEQGMPVSIPIKVNFAN